MTRDMEIEYTDSCFDDLLAEIIKLKAGDSICITNFGGYPDYNLDIVTDLKDNIWICVSLCEEEIYIKDYCFRDKDILSLIKDDLKYALDMVEDIVYNDMMVDIAEQLGDWKFDAESFGENIPNNWEEDTDILNEKLEIFSVHEYQFADVEEIASVLWEDYCNGNLKLNADEHYIYKFEDSMMHHYDLTTDGLADMLRLGYKLIGIEKVSG